VVMSVGSKKSCAYSEKEFHHYIGIDDRPWLHLEISLGCNIRCAMCTFHEQLEKVTWTSLSDVQDLGDELNRFGVVHLGDGSEPLVNPDWYQIVSHISQLGAKVSLQTNAKLIRDIKSAERIVNSGLHLLSISIDGMTDNTVSRIREGIDFSTIEQAIVLINQAKKKLGSETPHLTANIVAMCSNLSEIPDLISFLLFHDFIKARIGFLELRQENSQLVSELLIYDKARAKQTIAMVYQRMDAHPQPFVLDAELFGETEGMSKRNACTAYRDHIYARHDGEMFACYGKRRLGNLFADGVDTCLTSEEYADHVETVTTPGNNICSACSFCRVMSFDVVDDHFGSEAVSYYSRETIIASLQYVKEGGNAEDYWRDYYIARNGGVQC